VLRRQWNDLVLQMEPPEIFYTYEWACAVQAAYRESVHPLLFLGYENDNLVAVAALATDATEKAVRFLAGTTADYCDFVCDPKGRTGFVAAVLAKLKELEFGDFTLANLPAESATVAAIRTSAGKHGFHAYMRPAYLCAQVDLGPAEARQSLKTSVQKKKKLKYYLRAMEREGPVAVMHHQSRESIAEALPRFTNAHVARFEATGRTSNLASAERRRFLAELAERFGGTNAVTLTEMSVGGRPMAWNYGFQFQGSWFWYMPTFDTRDEANSPGYCLLAQIILEACDRPEMRVVDLGLGAEGYKERFGNSSRQTLHTTLTLSRARHWREVTRYRAATAVKKSPKLESAIRGVRDALRRATYKNGKNQP
jgi:CelD/BcsL family acetyltransferase involved in cellulose biosynthesis